MWICSNKRNEIGWGGGANQLPGGKRSNPTIINYFSVTTLQWYIDSYWFGATLCTTVTNGGKPSTLSRCFNLLLWEKKKSIQSNPVFLPNPSTPFPPWLIKFRVNRVSLYGPFLEFVMGSSHRKPGQIYYRSKLEGTRNMYDQGRVTRINGQRNVESRNLEGKESRGSTAWNWV